ncbi:MAG: hypothetical protein KatS3mg019_1860 [Fimbriimonadales bacterium]|nr:MAG: hypothetical protein KatS3mg019_1860 [Fimbriimonadales bacterium]
MALNALNWSDRLRPYRKRVRMLLMWRYGAMAGVAGAVVATVLTLLDWRGLLTVYPWQLGACVLIGVLLGALYGLLMRVSDAAVAQLIDRRAGLKDRLQTAMEHTDGAHLFDMPLIEDARASLQSAHPKQILRLRFGKWQKLFAGAVAMLLFFHFLPQLLSVALPERREEQKEIKQTAEAIQEVAKPILEEAQKPNADELTKRIAQNVELYNKRAREAKMSKQEALLRYNELMEQARQLEQQNQRQLEQLNQQAQTAHEQLQKLAEKQDPTQLSPELQQMAQQLQHELQSLQQQLSSGKDAQGNPLTAEQRAWMQQQLQRLQATMQAMRNANPADAQRQMNDLQRQMSDLQRQIENLKRQLESGKDAQGNPLSKEQMQQIQKQLEQLQKQMESMQQQLRALQLSQEAREFSRKLQEALRNDPAFQEAMEHLRKLAQQMQQQRQQQDPQQRQLTQQEIEQCLKALEQQLEALAQKYNSDEKIRELAQQMLEQVKQMKELNQCQGACMGLGMSNGFGLGMGASMSHSWGKGQGGTWDKHDYFGQPETFNQGEKQPELKIPMKDKAVSGSPPLNPSASDYIDYQAPPTPGGSSVPLTRALPTYQKKAEQAISQQNVPPAERKRVKRYFESLQSGK